MSDLSERAFATASIDEKQASDREAGESVQDVEAIARLRRENRGNRRTIAIYLLILFSVSVIPGQVYKLACHWRCTASCRDGDVTHITTCSTGPKGLKSDETFWTDWHDLVFLRRCLTLIMSCAVAPAMSWLVARSVYPDLRSDGTPIMKYPLVEERIGRALRWSGRSIWTSGLLFFPLYTVPALAAGHDVIAGEIKKYGQQRFGCDWPGTGWRCIDLFPDMISVFPLQLATQMICSTILRSENKARAAQKSNDQLDKDQLVDVKAGIESA